MNLTMGSLQEINSRKRDMEICFSRFFIIVGNE